MQQIAIGIDVGGTGIKGGLVDVEKGELIGERIRIPTPAGGEPEDIARVIKELIVQLDAPSNAPVGICFPSSIKNGVTLLAANISKRWINFEAEKFFENELGRKIMFVNDADAAGFAEVSYGVAKDTKGLVVVTTLGTGIGTALIYNGVLIPGSELGHVELNGQDAEKRASAVAAERDNLTREQYATERLQPYYEYLEMLLTPDLFIVGGGASSYADELLPLLKLRTPIIAAHFLNKAGILGAARLAHLHHGFPTH